LKAKAISILLTVVLIATSFTNIGIKHASAVEKAPELLITEVMPKAQNYDDPYEYIELYNNSDVYIDLKNYKFISPDADIKLSNVISPKGVMVICMRSNTSLYEFNKFYGTSIASNNYMTLSNTENVLDNSSQSIWLAKDEGNVVSMASYTAQDFDLNQAVTYRYPESGYEMDLFEQNQPPTPGTITADQVPDYGTRVAGISLDKTTATLEVGEVIALNATVTPSTATNKKVVWTSSNTDIAVVDVNGSVTAKATGYSIITAKTEDGGFTAKCTIIVSKVPVTGIVIDRESASIYVNQAIVLKATVIPEIATNKKVVWTSSDTHIATVDANGIVRGRNIGTATITVKTVDGNYTDSCDVTVYESNGNIFVTGVSLDRNEVSIEPNKAFALTATVKPQNATNKNVEWRSSNTNVASVDDNGIVFAKTLGTATITVITEDGNYSANCKVMVTNTPDTSVPVTGIKLNEQALIMELKETETLKATVLPSDAINKDVTWYSNDSSIVSVDQNGKLTALKEGVATITVTTEEGSYTAKCIVVVIKEDDHDDDDDDDDDDDKDKDEHPALSIKMNKTTLKMKDQQRYTLKAIVTPGVGRVTKLNWKSSNTSVAIVDNNGTVTPKGTGTAIITASTPDGKLSCQCTVTVYMSKSKGKGKK